MIVAGFTFVGMIDVFVFSRVIVFVVAIVTVFFVIVFCLFYHHAVRRFSLRRRCLCSHFLPFRFSLDFLLLVLLSQFFFPIFILLLLHLLFSILLLVLILFLPSVFLFIPPLGPWSRGSNLKCARRCDSACGTANTVLASAVRNIDYETT